MRIGRKPLMLALCGAMLVAGGCGGDDDSRGSSSDQTSQGTATATATSEDTGTSTATPTPTAEGGTGSAEPTLAEKTGLKARGARTTTMDIAVNELTVDGELATLTVTYAVQDPEAPPDAKFSLYELNDQQPLYVSLIDTVNLKRYAVVMDSDGKTLRVGRGRDQGAGRRVHVGAVHVRRPAGQCRGDRRGDRRLADVPRRPDHAMTRAQRLVGAAAALVTLAAAPAAAQEPGPGADVRGGSIKTLDRDGSIKTIEIKDSIEGLRGRAPERRARRAHRGRRRPVRVRPGVFDAEGRRDDRTHRRPPRQDARADPRRRLHGQRRQRRLRRSRDGGRPRSPRHSQPRCPPAASARAGTARRTRSHRTRRGPTIIPPAGPRTAA